MSGYFITYDPVTSSAGRITGTATAVNAEQHRSFYEEEGQPYVFVPFDSYEGYVVLGEDGAIGFETRPTFTGTWDTQEIPIGGVATLSDVPVCSITITGPDYAATFDHAGGNLPLQFVLPGTYTVEFEAFPMKTVWTQVTVLSAAANPESEDD